MSLASKRMSEEQIDAIKSNKKVKEFYLEQNELISDLLDPPEAREGAAEREERNQVKVFIRIGHNERPKRETLIMIMHFFTFEKWK